ncbi:MAG: hypothetical protein G01um101433_337 [Parcubacteria group bacterium Gr01-1014_33]|nr:MAG: hypothetical protein G01um101433_337 [Parcubacteria group bacterium Gr01-1014_33]
MNQCGFRLHYFRHYYTYRTIKLGSDVPFDVQNLCPCCGVELETFLTLVAGHDVRRMRIGHCSECGYSGYMDRPTKEWMENFYLNDWDWAKKRDAIKEAAHAKKQKIPPARRAAVHLAKSLAIGANTPVCDIGCGYGDVLKEFENIGFKNLIGVESSRFRSEFATKRYGYPVHVGNFENPKVAVALKSVAPIGIFFSAHVFEHVYNPNEFIRTAAALQEEGDHIILAMPNTLYEPVKTILFWLPHLHSYTYCGIEKLLNRHGYEVMKDASDTFEEIMVLAKKVASPRAHYKKQCVSDPVKKFSSFFLPKSLSRGKRYSFSWNEDNIGAPSATATFLPTFFDRDVRRRWIRARPFCNRVYRKFTGKRFKSLPMTLIESPLKTRFTSFGDSPIEIQYDGDIELLVR